MKIKDFSMKSRRDRNLYESLNIENYENQS